MNKLPTLQCRPALLRQWKDDVAKNPAAVATLMALSPDYIAMLVHDAAAAPLLLERALAAEFVSGCLGSVAPPSTADGKPCRLCQQVTQTVGWTCTGQCTGSAA